MPQRWFPLGCVNSGVAKVLVSAATAWEIATKHRQGKLSLVDTLLPRYASLLEADGFVELPISAEHALVAGSYPVDHRDPFDRMRVAQAGIERARLVSCDPALEVFGIELLW